MKWLIACVLFSTVLFGSINIIVDEAYKASEKKNLIKDINIAKTIWTKQDSEIYITINDSYMVIDKGDISAYGSVMICKSKNNSNVIKCFERETHN